VSRPLLVDCKEYIGIVSRQLPSIVSLSESKVHIISECPVEIPVGSYLVIESRSGDKRYLARVSESTIQDIYAIARVPVLSLHQEILTEIRPLPHLVSVDLVAECRGDQCTAPVTPVEIHSLVRFPKPGEVASMLNLPREGVYIGNLALPDGRELSGEHVYLPVAAIRHHILVVGTTGSGKTVFLKNLIYEVLKRDNTCMALALDTVGHYLHLVELGSESEISVIRPITVTYLHVAVRRVKERLKEDTTVRDVKRAVRRIAREVAREIVRDFLESTLGSFGLKYTISHCRVAGRYKLDEDSSVLVLDRVDVSVTVNESSRILFKIYLWALETSRVLFQLPKFTPVFTFQARMFYRRVLLEVLKLLLRERLGRGDVSSTVREMCKLMSECDVTLEDVYNFMLEPTRDDRGRVQAVYEVVGAKMGVHSGTLTNMLRGFLSLVETKLFDVNVRVKYGRTRIQIRVTEPIYDKLFSESRYIVVDLRDTSPSQQRLVVYRVLERLYRYVTSSRRDQNSTVLVVIDEAHTFFPQTREETEKELIESYLTMLARLGRARGIGLIFATHSPDDLNDLVIQLTNTKIILRSDEKILEKLGVPSQERRALVLAPPGLAYIKSFIYRTPIFVKLTPPRTLHVG